MQRFDLDEVYRLCPYCGETISLLIDYQADSQNYIEDCEVCCRPITVTVEIADDASGAVVNLYQENDVP